jgi:hypothetical protein
MPALSASVGNEREDAFEMILKEMLKQARGDCSPNVRIRMGSPLPCEAPDVVGVLLNMLGDSNDRLPAGVELTTGSLFAGKDPLCFSDGAGYGHVFSHALNQRLRAAGLQRVTSAFAEFAAFGGSAL